MNLIIINNIIIYYTLTPLADEQQHTPNCLVHCPPRLLHPSIHSSNRAPTKTTTETSYFLNGNSTSMTINLKSIFRMFIYLRRSAVLHWLNMTGTSSSISCKLYSTYLRHNSHSLLIIEALCLVGKSDKFFLSFFPPSIFGGHLTCRANIVFSTILDDHLIILASDPEVSQLIRSFIRTIFAGTPWLSLFTAHWPLSMVMLAVCVHDSRASQSFWVFSYHRVWAWFIHSLLALTHA